MINKWLMIIEISKLKQELCWLVPNGFRQIARIIYDFYMYMKEEEKIRKWLQWDKDWKSWGESRKNDR